MHLSGHLGAREGLLLLRVRGRLGSFVHLVLASLRSRVGFETPVKMMIIPVKLVGKQGSKIMINQDKS